MLRSVRVNRNVYHSREYLRKNARCIELGYNTKRPHLALGYRTHTRLSGPTAA